MALTAERKREIIAEFGSGGKGYGEARGADRTAYATHWGVNRALKGEQEGPSQSPRVVEVGWTTPADAPLSQGTRP